MCILLLFLMAQVAFGQQDSLKTYRANSVLVKHERFHASASSKIIEGDSNIRQCFTAPSLGDELQLNNGIHVKAYGGGLQAVSYRGTGAEHTSAYWEGVQVNSPMNGVVDFSLLPSFFLNDVKVNYGDGGAALGSGTVGGAVNTSSNLSFKKHKLVQFNYNAGSYASNSFGAGYSFSMGRFVSSTKLYYEKAQNDFKFNNPFKAGKPEERVKNNDSEKRGVLQQFGFKSGKNYWKISSLYLGSDRNLLNIASSNPSAYQKDQTVRSVLDYNRILPGHKKLFAKLGYTNEYLQYVDPGKVDDDYQVGNMIGQVGFKNNSKSKWAYSASVNWTSQRAHSKNYEENPDRLELGLVASLKYKIKKNLRSTTSVRLTAFNGSLIPLNFGEALTYKLKKNWLFKASFNTIYRLPTFNELYWLGSGNKDLNPEKGMKEDVGITYRKKGLELNATLYHMVVDDWLIWLPSASIWRPENIRKVKSKGAEVYAIKLGKLKKLNYSIKLSSSYVLSENVEVEEGNEGTIGKQLIYVPKVKSSGVLMLLYKKYKWTTLINYTGESFTSSDNRESIDPFMVVSSGVSREMKLIKIDFVLNLSVRNIADYRFETVLGRPMPGRTIWLKINIKLINK